MENDLLSLGFQNELYCLIENVNLKDAKLLTSVLNFLNFLDC